MLKVEGLTKHYNHHPVVDDLSFHCDAGEVLGFLGPNGAGKSTTMKMITGFVSPSGGTASICDHDIVTEGLAAKKRLGYLPEGAPCYAEMTTASFLSFIAEIRGLNSVKDSLRLDELIERLHLGPVLNQTVETLSKGFKRRVGLAQAILHDPDVLILDEPTDGLDPNQKHEVRELIRSMSAEKLIVISTHILEEVEAVCSRAIIIAQGKILADDSTEKLAQKSPYHNAVLINVVAGENLEQVQAALRKLDSVAKTEIDLEKSTITVFSNIESNDNMDAWRDITDLANTGAISIEGLELKSGRLEDYFRQITQGTLA
ncbi:MAG: ABC transporter ATP-binding protein [Woeseia sp.]|nr:ABC transporter ATP-binding protein [Woeseia sp.]|tara:strand:- start:36 stop:983 length:948 start_codon:yes stop_codon:yes gene_type:complete